jgi:outer membrane protein
MALKLVPGVSRTMGQIMNNPVTGFAPMRYFLSALLAVAVTSAAVAQGPSPVGPVLTLEEATQLALKNNPQHLQVRSNRDRAGNSLRTSYGALLPSASSSFSASYREGRQQLFEGTAFGAASDVLSSSAGVNVSLNLSGSTLLGPRQARASLEAADLNVTSSEQLVRMTVAEDYLNVLQAQGQAALQDTLLVNVQAQLDLARARQQVGAATILDVRNAEVQVGRQQVAVLRARNGVELATLQLFQAIGVPEQAGARLTTSFPMSEPTLQLPELLDMARKGNPALNRLRAQESAAGIGVTSARTAWIPSLNLSTGLNGYTSEQTNVDSQIEQARLQSLAARSSCFTTDSIRRGAGLSGFSTCSGINFTDAQANALRDANSQFPFAFTRSPFTYSASLSFPLFNGFQRERQIQEAQLSRNDARYALRDQELRLTSDVTSGYRNLTTAYQVVRLNEQNQQAAREALQLAQERYRVGANTFLDVTQAQSNFQQAATDLINSIYDFHKAYAALENAVGRPLR